MTQAMFSAMTIIETPSPPAKLLTSFRRSGTGTPLITSPALERAMNSSENSTNTNLFRYFLKYRPMRSSLSWMSDSSLGRMTVLVTPMDCINDFFCSFFFPNITVSSQVYSRSAAILLPV